MKKFKRVLSSLLAAALTVSAVAVANVSSVFAEDTVNTYYYLPAESINTGTHFTKSGSTATSYNLAGSFSFTGETNTHTTSTNQDSLKMDGSGAVTFSVEGTATVELVYSLRTNKTGDSYLKYVDANENETTLTDTATNDSYTKSSFSLNSGTYTIKRASGQEMRLYGIKLVDTISANSKAYTISGTSNLSSGDTFKIGEYTANVTAGGAWSCTKNAETAPFAVGDELAVSKDEYDVSPSPITLAEGSNDTSFDGGSLTFTKKELTNIGEGTYTAAQIENGLPNFDKSGLTVSSTGKYTGNLKLKLSDVATITVNGKCGSTDSAKDASVSIGEESYTSIGGSDLTDYEFVNVPAGDVTIAFAGNSTQFQVASITIAYGKVDVQTYTWKLDTSKLTNGIDTTKLSFKDETTTKLSNTLVYSGANYVINADNATVTGEADGDNVVTVTPEDSWFSKSSVITDKETLVFTASAGTATTESNVIIGNFTILAGSSSAIESNNASFEGLGTLDARYKNGGKTTFSNNVPTNRAIKFTTSGAGAVQIALRGSSGSKRTLNVYNSTGTISGGLTTTDTDTHILNVTLTGADTYYIASPDNGFGIYSVNVVVGETIDNATNGKVLSDTEDSYIIAGVTADEVANADNSEISISVNNNDAVTSNTVYKGVIIDGQYVSAEELGLNYIYVVKAVGAAFDDVKDFVLSFVTAE
jgi:hypothetical protein